MVEIQEIITVSTDVLGVGAHPPDVQSLYKRSGFRCNLEVVAMPVQIIHLYGLSRGRNTGFDLGGVHGQVGVSLREISTGVVDWAKKTTADVLLPPVNGGLGIPIGVLVDSIASQLDKPIYFNVHNDAVAHNFTDYQSYANSANKSYLTIENGTAPGDISRVVNLVDKLRDSGAEKTSGTFDLVHAVLSLNEGKIDIQAVTKHWKTVISLISDKFKHLHFPIGNRDCLPIMDMLKEKAMLTELGLVVKARGLSITLENQHNLLWGVHQPTEQKRLVEIREGLLECGFAV